MIDVSELGERVIVAIPDATRPIDLDRTVVPLLRALSDVGAEVGVEVALGLHRPMTPAELRPIRDAIRPFAATLRQHNAARDTFAPHVMQAESIVCVGVVEPHQYAGFSGGVKTVAIGCAPASHISHMHRVELLRDPRVTLGSYRGNPFQEALWETVRELPTMWGLYQVPAADQEAEIIFGPAESAMERAVEASRSAHFEVFDQPVDWLHLKVPAVKATNLYQASRAATYAGLVDPAAVRPGGLLIVEAAAPEGMGDGAGERACAKAMMRGRDALLQELDSDLPVKNDGGAQRAYVIAKTLRHFDIAFVGTTCGPVAALQSMGIRQFATAGDALEHFGMSTNGRVVSQPFHRVPMGPVT